MGASLERSARTRRQEERLPMRGAACVVEPDDETRDRISSLMRAMGYTTHETPSPDAGFFIAEQIHVQVALVNVLSADGLKLVRLLRTHSPQAVIIALAAQARAGIALVLSRIAGADMTLAAPVSNETIAAAVTEVLEGPRRRRRRVQNVLEEVHP